MKNLFIIFLNVICLSALAQPNLMVEEYATGFTLPVNIAHAGDERMFIVEQAGVIKIIDGSGVTRDTAFLDIRDRVNDGGSEQGLLGLAFPPDYSTSGVFYVYYTGGNGTGFSNISRFQTDPGNSNVALANSEEIILTFNQPFANHNGGDMNFDADGYLYIGTGDGGSAFDPNNNGQNRNTYLGNILRIDVDTVASYRIPEDNPFIGEANVKEEIWAWGLRNPWRFSFDRATDDMWIGDVGQQTREEVDFEPASSTGGHNYGWVCWEGNLINPFASNCNDEYTVPIFVYGHNNGTGGFSITGGYVYRGSLYPELYGNYICADYVSGNFWTISPEDNTEDEWINNRQNGLLTSVSTFGEDVNGELYVAKLNTGRIYKLSGDCPDSTIQVTIDLVGDSIVSNITNGQLTWFKDGNDLPDQNSGSIALQGEGNYLLNVVVNDNGCHYYGTSNLLNYLEDFECPDTSVTITITEDIDANTISQTEGPEGNYTWIVNGNEVNNATADTLDLLPFCCDMELQIQLMIEYELYFNDNQDTCTYVDASNVIDIPTSIFLQSIRSLELYPNPASKQINALLPAEIIGDILSIRLLNIQGQQEKFAYSLDVTNLNLDISKLSKGVYFLEISTNSERYLGKVVKE